MKFYEEKNYGQAYELFDNAVNEETNLHNVNALFMLGKMHKEGQGCTESFHNAVPW